MPFTAGDVVQTPFGKGIVREVRNGGRLLVDVGGRALVLEAAGVSALKEPRRRRPSTPSAATDESEVGQPKPRTGRASTEVDLHGLTVAEALARSERALNNALLDDVGQLRFIHGQSGGRIRAALHAFLGQVAAVRHFRVDPLNAGVTIADL